ncbi:recombination regulator RecX [Vibrio gallicus]|uniref:recombination regulator RecX n=1 Tax=Vibrio gallicus TaxID=190897 RepID=UPI0021C3F20E|nr:recombination regulator RecX [Vibrio gallicus]
MYTTSSKITPTFKHWSAKEAALNLLSRRDHGRYELQQKLLNRGYELADIDDAVSFCSEHHYLDDLRYAKSQVRQHVNKGHGERRIRQELQIKKVNEQTIEQALQAEPQDWFELAVQTAYKKFRDAKGSESKDYANQVRFLQYRGFSFEQIKYALSEQEQEA